MKTDPADRLATSHLLRQQRESQLMSLGAAEKKCIKMWGLVNLPECPEPRPRMVIDAFEIGKPTIRYLDNPSWHLFPPPANPLSELLYTDHEQKNGGTRRGKAKKSGLAIPGGARRR
jgi:hypothetical protein